MNLDASIGPSWADFPLGNILGPVADSATVRPFGLGHSSEPHALVDVDWANLRYDSAQQLAIVDDPSGYSLPAMKHTSTKTKTTTNTDDRNPSDDDEDWTGS